MFWLSWVWLIGSSERPEVGWNYYKEPIEYAVACVVALCTFYTVSEKRNQTLYDGVAGDFFDFEWEYRFHLWVWDCKGLL